MASLTFDNYVEVMFRQSVTIRAFTNSFLLAGSAALILVAVTVPRAYFIVWRNYPVLRVVNLAAELPYALPGIVLAIAGILLFLKPIPIIGVSIYGTVWIILAAYLARFLLAGSAALILVAVTVPLAYFIVWRNYPVLRVVNLAAELPYALPDIVLAIACILLFLKPIPIIGVSIYGTVWIILAAYLSRFLTLALRPVIGGFHQLDRHLEEAAQVAGAGFLFRVRTVSLPMVAPVAAAGGILVFLTAFNELTVSALLWSAGSETLGVVVFNLDDGGYTVLATAVAMVTVLVIVALMLGGSLIAKRMPPGVLPWEA